MCLHYTCHKNGIYLCKNGVQQDLLLAVPSHLVLVPWLFCPWFLLTVVPVPWHVGVLQSGAVCPRLVQLIWELGWPGVPLSVCPSHGLSLWGYLGHWLSCYPALPWSGWPSAWQSVVPVLWGPPQSQRSWEPLALTLSQISLFSLSAFWAATIN